MGDPNTMGAAELLRKYLESPAGSDLLGEMVKMAAELLMDADVDVRFGEARPLAEGPTKS